MCHRGHSVLSVVTSVSTCPPFDGNKAVVLNQGLAPLQYDLTLTSCHMYGPYFQIRSHSEVLRDGASTQEPEGGPTQLTTHTSFPFPLGHAQREASLTSQSPDISPTAPRCSLQPSLCSWHLGLASPHTLNRTCFSQQNHLINISL